GQQRRHGERLHDADLRAAAWPSVRRWNGERERALSCLDRGKLVMSGRQSSELLTMLLQPIRDLLPLHLTRPDHQLRLTLLDGDGAARPAQLVDVARLGPAISDGRSPSAGAPTPQEELRFDRGGTEEREKPRPGGARRPKRPQPGAGAAPPPTVRCGHGSSRYQLISQRHSGGPALREALWYGPPRISSAESG